jgi:hypothetical protein
LRSSQRSSSVMMIDYAPVVRGVGPRRHSSSRTR